MCTLVLNVYHGLDCDPPFVGMQDLAGVRGEGDQLRLKAPESGEAGIQEPLPGRQHEAETQLSSGAKLPL